MRALSTEQKQVCMLVGQGWKQKDAAAEVGVTEKTVSVWYRDLNGLGEAMAYWTSLYTDRYVARLYGKAIRASEELIDTEAPESRGRGIELVLKRLANLEKRQLEREKFEEAKRQAQAEQATGQADGVTIVVDGDA